MATGALASGANGVGVPATVSGSTFSPDGSFGQGVFDFTATAAATIAAPANLVPGRRYIFILRQDATGGRTWAWNAAYTFDAPWSDLNNVASAVRTQTFEATSATAMLAVDKLQPPRKSTSKTALFTLAKADNQAVDEYAGTFTLTIPAASVLGDCFRYTGIWVSGTITLDGPGATNGSVTSGRFDILTANANVYCTIHTATSAATTKLS